MEMIKIPLVVLVLSLALFNKAGGKYFLVETNEGAVTNQIEKKYATEENMEEQGADYAESTTRKKW